MQDDKDHISQELSVKMFLHSDLAVSRLFLFCSVMNIYCPKRVWSTVTQPKYVTVSACYCSDRACDLGTGICLVTDSYAT